VRFIALGTKTWYGPSVDSAYFITPCQTTLTITVTQRLKTVFWIVCNREFVWSALPTMATHVGSKLPSISCTFKRLSILLTSTQLDSACLHETLLPFLESWTILTAYKWKPV